MAIHSTFIPTVDLLTEPFFLLQADLHVFAALSSECDLNTFSSLVLAVDVSLVFKHFELTEN